MYGILFRTFGGEAVSKKEDEGLVRVKYRFRDETDFIEVTVTEEQYVNLLTLPMIATCEIIGEAKEPITESEKEMFNEKIKVACKNDESHTKYLLK